MLAAEIAILGSYPPPHGGAANHVFRLCGELERRGISFVVYNAVTQAHDGSRVVCVHDRRRRWLLEYLATAQERVIYFMSDRLAAWTVAAALERLRGKRVLVRLRNEVLPHLLAEHPRRGAVAAAMLRQLSGVVAVSQQLADTAVRVGLPPSRVHWSPGFLPPRQEEFDPGRVAREVMEFVDAHQPLIAASGRIMWHKGEDLYGLDMVTELVRRLRPDYPRIGGVVCFFDHSADERPRLDELRKRAAADGVGESVLFNTVPGPFLPVLARSDLFVRPTNTDGDANTVREAMALGVTAVASDVVERPAGAMTFRSRDHDDFERVARSALAASGSDTLRTGPPDSRTVDAYIDFLLGR